jgi:hypothetical protein
MLQGTLLFLPSICYKKNDYLSRQHAIRNIIISPVNMLLETLLFSRQHAIRNIIISPVNML